MKFKTNIVNLLIGTALGAAAVLSIAAASTDSFYCGRFQLVVTENYLYKIDTATGQVWNTYANSPSKSFLAPNIGRTNAVAPNPATTNLEKNAER